VVHLTRPGGLLHCLGPMHICGYIGMPFELVTRVLHV
jgi:hypothetical protein